MSIPIERFRLARNCKLNETETISAGTPVRILQAIGAKVLVQIPSTGGEIQKFVNPEDLQFFGAPVWCYDMSYTLNEIDLFDNKQTSTEESEEFEGRC
jgi:hypothetical protein